MATTQSGVPSSFYQIQNFTELDFEKLKDELKEYIKNHPSQEFTDFNFEGSNLSFLLDVLTYNAQQHAFYANMMYGENFLVSAQRRKSVVSLAKNIGYLPRAQKPARSKVRVEIIPKDETDHPDILSVFEGMVFSGKNTLNKEFKFHTTEDKTLTRIVGSDNAFVGEFDVFEGLKKTYEVQMEPGENGVVLPSKGVDYDLIDVFVTTKGSETVIPFKKANDYNQVKSTDQVYWVEEIDGERHRIYFGENVVGMSPDRAIENISAGVDDTAAIGAGNQPLVRIEYFVNHGPEANNIKTLTYVAGPKDNNFDQKYIITLKETMELSNAGRQIESIESIKHYAPLFYKAQHRAVTYEDYEAVIAHEFPEVDDIAVWGGEENDPPAYGFVYISIKPRETGFLSDFQETRMAQFLKRNYSIISIDPVFVNPAYMHTRIDTIVSFDSTLENEGAGQIKAKVVNAIQEYSRCNLEKYSKALRFSKLVAAIDDSSTSIVSNNTQLRMEVRPSTVQEVLEKGYIDFFNSLEQGSFETNAFGLGPYNTVRAKDIDGVLYLYYYDTFEELPVLTQEGEQFTAGTINYETGRVKLLLNASQLDLFVFSIQDGFRMSAKTAANDVVTGKQNTILLIDPDQINVEVRDIATGISTG